MFIGKYEHSIDTKGRLIVPSKFREGLEDKFVVTVGLDGCLFAYGIPEFQKIAERLAETVPADAEGRAFLRAFYAAGTEVEIDKQGRILLSAELREAAGITKDVVSVGGYNKIEIWSKERFQGKQIGYEKMDDIMERISGMGIRL